ncbi:MAG: T9SS type A sorting domain-containing protein, partial [Ignavibacteria bacterium]|nr:T9SS type A sorting domain-containing protein [Ignavibacteria bacterium]
TNYVSLKVFDVLGNEVAALVNEKQNAGSYTVDFDGADFPSGIYFYKLETGNFSEVKKMTLLK